MMFFLEDGMRRKGVFWGIIIILLGLILLLNNLGWLPGNVWSLFWPMALIGSGLWYLLGPMINQRAPDIQKLGIPLEEAASAAVKIRARVVKLVVSAADGSVNLLEGNFENGEKHECQRAGSHTSVNLNGKTSDFFTKSPPSPGFRGNTWEMTLNPTFPLILDIKSGANEARLNLEGLKIAGLEPDTRASSNEITIPAAAGLSTVRIQPGAAANNLHLPLGVAGCIRRQGGLPSKKDDPGPISPLMARTMKRPGLKTFPTGLKF
jgi:hypothetical protein